MEFTKQSHPDIKVREPEEKLGTLGEQLKAKGQSIFLAVDNTTPTQEKKKGGNKKPADFRRRETLYGEVVLQTIKNIDGIRKGTPGNPTEINQAVQKARESVPSAKRNLDEIKKRKDGLLLLLADLRAQQKQVEQGDFSEATREHIRGSIVDAQRKLSEINSAIPNTNPLEDNRKIQGILDKWERGKQPENPPQEPEKVAPGIFGHTEENKIMQEEMDTLNKKPNNEAPNNMNFEQPSPQPEEKDRKTEEVEHLISGEGLEEAIQARILELGGKTDEESVKEKGGLQNELAELHKNIGEGAEKIEAGQPNRVEEREQEVVARQAELEGKDDIASKEERAELGEEYASIQKRREEIKKVNPLQSPYDRAMERLNEEHTLQVNEAWKLEEINNTEKFSKKEGDVEVKNDPIAQETTTIALKESISLAEEEVRVLREHLTKTQEQLNERLAQMEKKVEARAEKAGLTETIFNIGRAYQKWPLKHKLLISGVLFLTASSLAVVGGTAGTTAILTAGLTGLLPQRIVGGFATAAMAEGLLTKFSQGNGRIREEGEKNRHTAEAIILGMLVGGGVLGHAVQNVFHEFVPVHETSIPKSPTNVAENHITSSSPTPENHTGYMMQDTNGSYVENIKMGGSVWKVAEHQLQEHFGKDFTNLPEGQRTYLIDAIKNKIVADPTRFGVTSGDANVLAVGDHLNFKEIFSDQTFMKETLINAHQLTPGQIAGIENYSVPESAPVAEVAQHGTVPNIAHPETTPTPDITNGTSDHIKEVAQRISSGGMENNEGLKIGKVLGEAVQGQDPTKILALEKQLGLTHQEFIQMLNETNKLGEINFKNDLIQQVDKLGATTVSNMDKVSAPIETVVVPSSQILEQAGTQVHNHINSLFGTKGFFGFGAVDGMDTPNWKDATHGFANKTVTEIVQIKPENMQSVAGSIGMDNKDAVTAIRKYIDETFIASRVQPLEGETLANYFKRATAMAINSKTK